jgi:hypothetical protein
MSIGKPKTVGLFADKYYEEFRFRKYDETIFNLACLMDATAPKNCECGVRLNVAELSYRFAINIEPFLCYKCLIKYEKLGAVIMPSEESGYPRKIRVNKDYENGLMFAPESPTSNRIQNG